MAKMKSKKLPDFGCKNKELIVFTGQKIDRSINTRSLKCKQRSSGIMKIGSNVERD